VFCGKRSIRNCLKKMNSVSRFNLYPSQLLQYFDATKTPYQTVANHVLSEHWTNIAGLVLVWRPRVYRDGVTKRLTRLKPLCTASRQPSASRATKHERKVILQEKPPGFNASGVYCSQTNGLLFLLLKYKLRYTSLKALMTRQNH